MKCLNCNNKVEYGTYKFESIYHFSADIGDTGIPNTIETKYYCKSHVKKIADRILMMAKLEGKMCVTCLNSYKHEMLKLQ